MFLKDLDFKAIITEIILKGGKSFLYAICIVRVPHQGISTKCPVCYNDVGVNGESRMLNAAPDVHAFSDRFDSHDCAERAIKWLHSVLAEYEKNLKAAKAVSSNPHIPGGIERRKKEFRHCHIGRFEHLEDFAPKFNRKEDYSEYQKK